MPNSTEHISKRLKKFRELRNLSVKEVAKLIGVPESTYREWEYGRAIRGEPYLKLTKALGITLNDLLGENKISSDAYEREFDKIIEEVTKLKTKLNTLKNKRYS
ncbi:MAG: helix-turn-helix transcriptional regulator [Rhizobacter sp.]|nr:helix-turn-helix transcriptional regulator [Bacteriovorax sp.]